MSQWCEAAPGGRAADQLGDVAPHGVALNWLYPCLLAGLVGGMLLAFVALPPRAARRVVLTYAAGSGALAAVLAAALGRPWPLVAALAVLAGLARDRRWRWLPAAAAVLAAVLAVVEPATVFAPLGGLAAYAMARHEGAAVRDHAAPLVAVALILVATAGFPAPPAATPAPVVRAGAVADLTVSVNQTGRAVTVRTASARRPPPAPIDDVGLELDGHPVALLPAVAGRYSGVADLPSAGTRVLAVVTVRRSGERLTVPLAWVAPAAPASPSRLPGAGLLVLAVLMLAALQRKDLR
ncbi:hypothetical protein ODJ79_04505 [Actinoplanes sp. KI2]|uniref:hypothetical protein n=1 Tax=Actinoplanes sp. KI2 TaxID=2983315 RepID=UPI0021D5B965|nr:hypothetical protein [Actinoplanes sp. KI2]MCU7722968.1 hypothetical protein [Actinoplanes sp. KI2]